MEESGVLPIRFPFWYIVPVCKRIVSELLLQEHGEDQQKHERPAGNVSWATTSRTDTTILEIGRDSIQELISDFAMLSLQWPTKGTVVMKEVQLQLMSNSNSGVAEKFTHGFVS